MFFGMHPDIISLCELKGQFFILVVVFSYINIVAITGNIMEGFGFHLHFGTFFVFADILIKKGISMFPVEPISGKMLDYYVGRKDSFLIDLRNPKEYHTGHIKGAVNVPYEKFEEMQT